MHERLLHGSPELFVNGKNEKMDFIMCLDFEILHINAIFSFINSICILFCSFFQLSGIAKSICGFLLSHLSVFVMTCRHLLIFSFISCILIKLIKLTKAVSYMHVSIFTYIYFCIMYKLTAIRIIPNCPNYS